MRLKIDENLPAEAADVLREHGYEADTVCDEDLTLADDGTLAAHVRREQRTLDLDFANIRAYPPGQHAGIVVLRLTTQDKRTVLAMITHIAAVLKLRDPREQLWIVEPDRIRFRSA